MAGPGKYKSLTMTKYTVINQDVLEWAREYDGPPFMACLYDPPYDYQCELLQAGRGMPRLVGRASCRHDVQ